jgi:hypothetical protein
MSNSTLDLHMRVRRIDDVLDTEIDEQTVMMDIEKGSYLGLNRTGSRIWSLLAEAIAISELCDRLTAEFDVSREQCEQQVMDFLGSLLDRGLLQVVTDETS